MELTHKFGNKKCSSRLYLLQKLKHILSKKDLICVYYATIQSIIDYASPSFVNLPLYLEQKLKSTVRRSHCIICGTECTKKCLPDPLIRRQQLSMKYFLEAENNVHHILHNFIPHRFPRTNKVYFNYCKTNRRKNEFIPFTTELINNLS